MNTDCVGQFLSEEDIWIGKRKEAVCKMRLSNAAFDKGNKKNRSHVQKYLVQF